MHIHHYTSRSTLQSTKNLPAIILAIHSKPLGNPCRKPQINSNQRMSLPRTALDLIKHAACRFAGAVRNGWLGAGVLLLAAGAGLVNAQVQLILIRFQDEPNSGRVAAWLDHAGSIYSSLSGRK